MVTVAAAMLAKLKKLVRGSSPCKCAASGYCGVHLRSMSDREWNRCRRSEFWYRKYQQQKFDLLDKQMPESQRFISTSRESVENMIGVGPGTELMLILANPFWRRIGVKATSSCKCIINAAVMNREGYQWVLQNVLQIADWLMDEHRNQRIAIPFSNVTAKLLVRLALRHHRKRHRHGR